MDDAAAPAPPAIPASVAGAPGTPLPPRKATLARLEALAIQELLQARPLPGGSERVTDPLLACISWDLDSPAP